MVENKQPIEKKQLEEFLQFSIKTARGAGEILMSYWGKAKVMSDPLHPHDIVTDADLASEHYIIEAIRRNYPLHLITSEEQTKSSIAEKPVRTKSVFEIVVDPLDATNNFQRKNEMFSVVMALRVEGNGMTAVVFAPAKGRLYWGVTGQGAYCEDAHGKQLIRVSGKESVNMFTMGFSVGNFIQNKATCDQVTDRLLSSFPHFKPRMMESSALEMCMVADGQMDAHLNNIGKPWDVAAEVIVREAGGVVTNIDDTIVLASNGHFHEVLLDCMQPLVDLHRPRGVK